MLIMAIGVIGIAALQITSSAFTESSLHRSQASALAREMVESMRANVIEAKASNYDFGDYGEGNYDIASLSNITTDCEDLQIQCTGLQMKDHDLRAWSAKVVALLPSGDALISTSDDGGIQPVDITIALQWDESRGQRDPVSQAFTFKLLGLDRL